MAKGPSQNQEKNNFSPTSISLIIPFRNEAENLPKLLDSLRRQDYSKGHLEILLIDDHSYDQGISFIEESIPDFPFPIRLISLVSQIGKKAAMIEAIKEAKGDLILCTDADCYFGPNWVESFHTEFQNSNAAMICGSVLLESGNSFIESWQKVEQAILMTFTQQSIYRKRAILANGANMAFQRELFKAEFFSASSSQSGDDIFLLQELKKRYPDKIKFNASKDALVYTSPKSSWKSFLLQRLRWASKSKHYKDSDMLWIGGGIFLCNLIVVSLLIGSIINSNLLVYFLIFFLGKMILDGATLIHARDYLNIMGKVFWWIVFSFFYPLYSIGIALLSLLFKPKWKGRSV